MMMGVSQPCGVHFGALKKSKNRLPHLRQRNTEIFTIARLVKVKKMTSFHKMPSPCLP